MPEKREKDDETPIYGRHLKKKVRGKQQNAAIHKKLKKGGKMHGTSRAKTKQLL